MSDDLNLKLLVADIAEVHALVSEAREMQSHVIEDGVEIERDVRELEPVLWRRLDRHLTEKSL